MQQWPNSNDPTIPNTPVVPAGQQAPSRPYRYGGWGLTTFVGVYLVSWWFAIIGSIHDGAMTNLAFDFVVFESWAMFALDWRGFTSLNGRAVWSRLSKWKKFWLVCGLLFMPEIMVGVYFGYAIADYYRATHQKPRAQVQTLYQGYKVAPAGKQAVILSSLITGSVIFLALSGVAFANGVPSGDTSTSSVSSGTTSTSGSLVATTHSPTSTSGSSVAQVSITTIATSTQNTAPTAIPTTQPTDTPQPQPTATPKPVPTATPKPQPTCIPGAVNCNPWGYNFNPGNLIYSPPGNFCSYFACIPSFWTSTNGYVVECVDGDYSHSGGRSGACSYHGGEWRPLYSH